MCFSDLTKNDGFRSDASSSSSSTQIRHSPSCSQPPRPPGPAIDWLPSFSGLSWIAHRASSLLVLSTFPSPLSRGETAAGPIVRQVFELSGESVNAVSWSSASPYIGELVAAAGNCVRLFTHDSASTKGLEGGELIHGDNFNICYWELGRSAAAMGRKAWAAVLARWRFFSLVFSCNFYLFVFIRIVNVC